MRVGACLVLLGAIAGVAQAGPSEQAPVSGYAQLGLNQAAGRQSIERLKQGILPGQVYLEFTLRILPRRSEEHDVPGRLWAAQQASGPVLRAVLDPGGPGEVRWLIRGGADAAVWKAAGGGAAAPANPLEPLFPGSQLTAFDLQMSFLWWPDQKLVAVVRKLGRPADEFLFRPPEDFARRHPGIWGVEAFLDGQFHVPVEIDILGPGGAPQQVLSALDLKRVRDQYLVKELDARDERSRDSTRVDFTAASLDQDFASGLFEPGELGSEVAPPPPGRIDRFGP